PPPSSHPISLLDRLISSPPLSFFFFNHTATTAIYTLSLHDALPIYLTMQQLGCLFGISHAAAHRVMSRLAEPLAKLMTRWAAARSEEHTSELQSLTNLVCRLLLEKKKRKH